MARVRQKNTKPEVTLRRWLHAAGYRFRLQRRDLPGTPDIVLPRYRTAIFVHGCFWHGHDCKAGRAPSSNAAFWEAKITRNKARDAEVAVRLVQLGWRRLEVWQCELKDKDLLLEKLRGLFPLEPDHGSTGARKEGQSGRAPPMAATLDT